MQIFLYPLAIFLFSLPWRLNGSLTTSKNTPSYHGNITNHHRLTKQAEKPSGETESTIDSEEENVVSLSRRIKALQHLTSHSEQQGIQKTLNHRMKRNTHDSQHNLTTPAQDENQTQKEITQKQELLNPTESSTRPQAFSTFQTQNSTELTVPTKSPKNMTATTGLLNTTEDETWNTTKEVSSASAPTGLHDPEINGTFKDGSNSTTIQPTMKTTVFNESSTTQPHTSKAVTSSDPNRTVIGVSVTGVKTTERSEITHKWSARPKFTTKQMIPPRKPKDNQQHKPGAAVAAVIGTTFVLMFIAMIVILVRKRKIQKKRLENPEWAGPSPFLDGDIQPNLPSMDESEPTHRRGFNQISISRYLPSRISKHLSLQRNTDEDVIMGDILQGSTFGRQNLDEDQAHNGKSVPGKGSTIIEENENDPGLVSVDSTDIKTPSTLSAQEPPAEDIQEPYQDDGLDPSLPYATDTAVKPYPPLVSIDLDSLSEEPVLSQTPDVGIIPPAPPLS